MKTNKNSNTLKLKREQQNKKKIVAKRTGIKIKVNYEFPHF